MGSAKFKLCLSPAEELLHSLSFTIEEGEAVALMGPNGSGKTTLGKLLVGILKPSAGQILLEGSDLAELSLAEIGAKVGYIFQNPEKQIFTPSVEEEIAFGLRFRGYDEAETRRRVNDMLAYFELTHCAGQFPYNLSQGEKQRYIAAVLALEPRFIILMNRPPARHAAERKICGSAAENQVKIAAVC